MSGQRPEHATLLVHGVGVWITWAELDQISRLSLDNPRAALALGEKWLSERKD